MEIVMKPHYEKLVSILESYGIKLIEVIRFFG